MKEGFVFWAQALDNMSPDDINSGGVPLSVEDSASRQDAVSKVSRTVKLGARVFDELGVQLTVANNRFVLEVPSSQRDQEGRVAPIVCYGNIDTSAENELGKLVVKQLEDFAKQICRSILPEHLTLVTKSFETLKKKSYLNSLVRRLATGVLVISLLVLLWWIA